MRIVDPHLAAVIVASDAVLYTLRVMPKTDLVEESIEVMQWQRDIFECILAEKHFGTDNVNCVIQMSVGLKDQVKRISEEL